MQKIAIQIKQKWPEAAFTACAAGEEKLSNSANARSPLA
jgi:hypothetical protein